MGTPTMISTFLAEPPLLYDDLQTRTTELQAATIAECLPLLNGTNHTRSESLSFDAQGTLDLDVLQHIAFLHDNLSEFPPNFVGIDASRPWMVYWALLSLFYLGEDISVFREEVVKTFLPLQNASGGYGGGQGHSSHLACTYAALLSLTLVGGQAAYQLTDRQALWQWLGRLKQNDGGFTISEGGEEDTRASYTALLAIALLKLPWELPSSSPARQAGYGTFGDGLGEYISRCQTYEGGISSAPGTEAHGAYTFCALACLCLLDRPDRALTKYTDMDTLVGWLSCRQYSPEGGLAGRTNKVVDGCYSHWLGTCWSMVQAAIKGPVSQDSLSRMKTDNDLYSTDGLARYVLNCCQHPDGGLRDKPSKRPDSYHTCYTLTGLSTTQHCHYFTPPPTEERFASAFAWNAISRLHDGPNKSIEEQRRVQTHSQVGSDARVQLNAVHPVFVIPHAAVLNMRGWVDGEAMVS